FAAAARTSSRSRRMRVNAPGMPRVNPHARSRAASISATPSGGSIRERRARSNARAASDSSRSDRSRTRPGCASSALASPGDGWLGRLIELRHVVPESAGELLEERDVENPPDPPLLLDSLVQMRDVLEIGRAILLLRGRALVRVQGLEDGRVLLPHLGAEIRGEVPVEVMPAAVQPRMAELNGFGAHGPGVHVALDRLPAPRLQVPATVPVRVSQHLRRAVPQEMQPGRRSAVRAAPAEEPGKSKRACKVAVFLRTEAGGRVEALAKAVPVPVPVEVRQAVRPVPVQV